MCQAAVHAAGCAPAALAVPAADDAAWTELQRGAAWWLGEHVNAAAGECAGYAEPEQDAAGSSGTDAPGESVDEDAAAARLSPAETIALQVPFPSFLRKLPASDHTRVSAAFLLHISTLRLAPGRAPPQQSDTDNHSL